MEMEYKAVDNKLRRSRYFWRQLAVCITSTVFYFLIGLTLGSPTVTVPQLREEANSTAAVSEEMASWLTSIMPYTATFWVLIIIIAAHYFGRKRPMIVIALNSLCGYILFYCSKNVFHVLLSQATQGLTQAAYTTTCAMMVLEYTSPHYRGLFLGFFSATYFWGIWAANIIGTFCNFRYIALLGIVCAVSNFIALIFLPESPFWLACQGRYDECAVVHRWLKGVDDESEKELKDLINAQKEFKMSTTKTKKSVRGFIRSCRLILRDPQIYKSLTCAVMTMPPYLLSGKLICAVYALEIMKKITETESQAYMGILILDGFSVAGMYFGSFLLNRTKRRTLLIGSCITTSFFLLTISISIYLVKSSLVPENVYVSLVFLIGFTLSACGTLIVSAALFLEFYPTKYRTVFMCILCIFSKLVLGTTLKLAPLIFMKFYVQGAFLFYGISLLLSTIIVYKYLPETKGKTIQEISEMFQKTKSKIKINDKETRLLDVS